MRELPVLKLNLSAPETFGNVAEELNQSERRTLATDLIELIAIDDTSMNPWRSRAQGYLDAVKAERGRKEPQNREQEGAGEGAPPATELTLSAVIQFSARAADAILGEPDLAKASEPGGEGLAAWVSSQLRTKDPNWTLDTDPLVVHMGVTGLGWRKRSFDLEDKAFTTHFLTSTSDVIINANVRSVERAPRITHQFDRYPYEIQRSIERGKWVDYEPKFDDNDPQAPKKFYEVDAWLDLDGDEIDEPWTITISRDDMAEVVKIIPRWSKKSVVNTKEELFFNPIRRFYPYSMLPDPEGGFFPMGFGALLDRVEGSADQLLAAIVDTAKSESENGGILAGGGFGLPDKIEMKGNRITTVNTDGAPLANRFSAFPIKSVSPGSVAVLEKLMTLGDRMAGVLNMLENAPASMTATMAKGIIDAGTQVQSAIHRRMVTSMTQEFRMFVQMADAYDALPEGLSAADSGSIAVTADPALATEMHRSALAGIYMQMLHPDAGGVFNRQVAAKRFCETMRLPNPEELIAQPQAPEASPDEKMKGALGLMKEQREKIKTTADAAVKLTQALLNMTQASGGMIGNQTAMLQMAQLEETVKQLMADANNVGSGLDGMAQQPGNPGAPGAAPPQAVGGGQPVPGGAAGGPGDAGPGSGLQ